MIVMLASAVSLPAIASETFNGRSTAMGGAGVTVGDYASGSSINPALVGASSEKDTFALNTNVGVMVSDQNEVGEDVMDALDLVDSADEKINSGDPVLAAQGQDDLEEAVDLLAQNTNKPVVLEAGAGVYVTVPNKYANVSLSANNYTFGNVMLSYDSADDLATSTEDLESRGVTTGFMLNEFGITAAKSINVPKMGDMMMGATVKNQTVETFAYSEVMDDFDPEIENRSKDSNLNVDFGLYKDYGNGWSSGFVAKNLVKKTYETDQFIVINNGVDYVVTGEAKIEPRMTIGGGYQTKSGGTKFALEADLNATEEFAYNASDAVGIDADFEKQFVRAGVQFGHPKAAQLRLGYRHDLKGNFDDTASLGLGLSPFNVVNLDLAVTVGKKQSAGVTLQAGFRF